MIYNPSPFEQYIRIKRKYLNKTLTSEQALQQILELIKANGWFTIDNIEDVYKLV